MIKRLNLPNFTALAVQLRHIDPALLASLADALAEAKYDIECAREHLESGRRCVEKILLDEEVFHAAQVEDSSSIKEVFQRRARTVERARVAIRTMLKTSSSLNYIAREKLAELINAAPLEGAEAPTTLDVHADSVTDAPKELAAE